MGLLHREQKNPEHTSFHLIHIAALKGRPPHPHFRDGAVLGPRKTRWTSPRPRERTLGRPDSSTPEIPRAPQAAKAISRTRLALHPEPGHPGGATIGLSVRLPASTHFRCGTGAHGHRAPGFTDKKGTHLELAKLHSDSFQVQQKGCICKCCRYSAKCHKQG